jgi:GT2 family glycosyltransferase
MVIPSVKIQWAKECVQSLNTNNLENVLVVDNTKTNYGVAGAWNLGIDKMYKDGSEWLIICSESIRFYDNPISNINNAIDNADKSTLIIEGNNGQGWHLIIFNRKVFDTVGYFDEIFYPAYCEDNDYIIRYSMAFPGVSPAANMAHLEKVSINAKLLGIAYGITHVTWDPDYEGQIKKFIDKWGDGVHNRPSIDPEAIFKHPYNNPELTYRYAQRILRA